MKKDKILVGNKWAVEVDLKECLNETLAYLEAAKTHLRAHYPDYESLLNVAAAIIVSATGKEKLVQTIIERSNLPINERLDFIEALHPDSAAVLKNTLKTKTADAGAKGGQKRSARYQVIETEVIAAYLADDAAQAAKTIDSATHKLMTNRPDLCEKVNFRKVRDLISKLRKNAA